MRSLWRKVLDIDTDTTVLEDVEFDEDTQGLVVHVRPKARQRQRCGRCGRRSAWYDAGEGRRRWRHLDVATTPVWFEADAPRVSCKVHGVVVTQVPWARHDARFTRQFDDTVAWLATQCSKTAITQLLRIAWRTVGSIIARVVADIDNQVDRLEGLARIGIDEIGYDSLKWPHRDGLKWPHPRSRSLRSVTSHSDGRRRNECRGWSCSNVFVVTTSRKP